MNASPAASPYTARLAELRAELAALEARGARISSLRGLTFIAAVALAAVRIFRPVPPLVWILAAAFAAAFVGLVVMHALLVTRMAALEVRVRLLERGEKRVAGELAALPDRGDRFLQANHAYAGDLDVFGSSSLFQLVCSAETGPGEATLARWLSEPADAAEIAARQEAVRELAGTPRFREDLAALGVDTGTKGRDAEPFLAWAEAKGDAPSGLFLNLGRGLVVITVSLLVAAEALGWTGLLRASWMIPLVAQLAVLFALRPAIEPILAPAASKEAPFGRWVAMFRLVEAQRFESPRLAALHARMTGASAALARLGTIVGYAEVRHAGIVALFANVFLLWDVFCAAALARWRDRHGASVRAWIAAMAELEALASLATFSAEHPAYAFPRVDDGDLRFVATELGHPLIPPARRVANDVALPSQGSALLVTGSNMSGKSTLLRAIGLNAVLALAGAPVAARSLEMATSRVRTSMRIKDSLEEGVSHFYAELGRLKAVVDAVNGGERVLFLLDEVLHGTNSRERRIGAKAVVSHVLAQGAIGAVSSHDLGLSDLEEASAGRVKNVHFQELVAEGKMSFDYKLKPGVVTSSNALRLMKLIGIGVELPD
jgi:hypothetical protein